MLRILPDQRTTPIIFIENAITNRDTIIIAISVLGFLITQKDIGSKSVESYIKRIQETANELRDTEKNLQVLKKTTNSIEKNVKNMMERLNITAKNNTINGYTCQLCHTKFKLKKELKAHTNSTICGAGI